MSYDGAPTLNHQKVQAEGNRGDDPPLPSNVSKQVVPQDFGRDLQNLVDPESELLRFVFSPPPWKCDKAECWRLICAYLNLVDIVRLSCTSALIHKTLVEKGFYYPFLRIHSSAEFTIPYDLRHALLWGPSTTQRSNRAVSCINNSTTQPPDTSQTFIDTDGRSRNSSLSVCSMHDGCFPPMPGKVVSSITPYSPLSGAFKPFESLDRLRLMHFGTKNTKFGADWFLCSRKLQQQWLGRLRGVRALHVDVDVTGQRGIEPISLARLLLNNQKTIDSLKIVWRAHTGKDKFRSMTKDIARWWNVARDSSLLTRKSAISMLGDGFWKSKFRLQSPRSTSTSANQVHSEWLRSSMSIPSRQFMSNSRLHDCAFHPCSSQYRRFAREEKRGFRMPLGADGRMLRQVAAKSFSHVSSRCSCASLTPDRSFSSKSHITQFKRSHTHHHRPKGQSKKAVMIQFQFKAKFQVDAKSQLSSRIPNALAQSSLLTENNSFCSMCRPELKRRRRCRFTRTKYRGFWTNLQRCRCAWPTTIASRRPKTAFSNQQRRLNRTRLRHIADTDATIFNSSCVRSSTKSMSKLMQSTSINKDLHPFVANSNRSLELIHANCNYVASSKRFSVAVEQGEKAECTKSATSLPVLLFPLLQTVSIQLHHQYASEFFSGCRFPACKKLLIEEVNPFYDRADVSFMTVGKSDSQQACYPVSLSCQSKAEQPERNTLTVDVFKQPSTYELPCQMMVGTSRGNMSEAKNEENRLGMKLSCNRFGRDRPDRERDGPSHYSSNNFSVNDLEETLGFHTSSNDNVAQKKSSFIADQSDAATSKTELGCKFNGDHIAHWLPLLMSSSSLEEAYLFIGGSRLHKRRLQPMKANLQLLYKTLLNNNETSLEAVGCQMPELLSQSLLKVKFEKLTGKKVQGGNASESLFPNLVEVNCYNATFDTSKFALNVLLELPRINWLCRSIVLSAPRNFLGQVANINGSCRSIQNSTTVEQRSDLVLSKATEANTPLVNGSVVSQATSQQQSAADGYPQSSTEKGIDFGMKNALPTSNDPHNHLYRPQSPTLCALLERLCLRLLASQIETIKIEYVSEDMAKSFRSKLSNIQGSTTSGNQNSLLTLLQGVTGSVIDKGISQTDVTLSGIAGPTLNVSLPSMDYSSKEDIFFGPLVEGGLQEATSARKAERPSVVDVESWRSSSKAANRQDTWSHWPQAETVDTLIGIQLTAGMIEALSSSRLSFPYCNVLEIQTPKNIDEVELRRHFLRLVFLLEVLELGNGLRNQNLMKTNPRLRVYAAPETPGAVFAALPRFHLHVLSLSPLLSVLSSRKACKRLRGIFGAGCRLVLALQTIRSKLYIWQRPDIEMVEVWIPNVMIRCLCAVSKLCFRMNSFRHLTEFRIFPKRLPSFLSPDDVFCSSSPESLLLNELVSPFKFQRARREEIEIKGLYDMSLFVFTRRIGFTKRLFGWNYSSGRFHMTSNNNDAIVWL